jgi:Domain of Unknown Function (DUF326)
MIRSATLVLFATVVGLTIRSDTRADHEHKHPMMECAKACDDCARHCDMCVTHCGKMLMEGKKEHAASHLLCSDCATICRAAGGVTARQGPLAHLLCGTCADACKECGDACEKLASDPMMKACADECRKCEKACREMAKMKGDHKH